MTVRAACRGEPLNRTVPSARPSLEQPAEPRLVVVEEAQELRLHRLGERAVLGGEHAAQAHPIVLEDTEIEGGIGPELAQGVDGLAVDTGQLGDEADRVALDERGAELGLAGEVIVEGRRRDPELGRDIGIAEPVEPPGLHQALGDVEDPRGGVAVSSPWAWHPAIGPLTLTY